MPLLRPVAFDQNFAARTARAAIFGRGTGGVLNEQTYTWQQNACRIGAAFDYTRVRFEPNQVPLTHCHSVSFERDMGGCRRVCCGPFSSKYFLGTGKTIVFDSAFINFSMEVEQLPRLEIELCRIWQLLGINISDRISAYEAWRKKPFPQQSAHEQLEAQLQYRERLAHHCNANGVPVPSA